MKEMIYKKENTRELLFNGIYKGIHYYIMSYGSHPCAYVEIPKNNEIFEKCYMDLEIDFDIHGGITYSRDYLKIGDNTELANSWFIGWDYAHVGDFKLIGNYVEEGKEWTTEELQDDCIYFIEQLRRKTKWD